VPSEIARLTDRLLLEVAAREPLPREEEARLARLVAEGKDARRRLAEPGVPAAERQRLEEIARRGRDALAQLVEHNLGLVVRMTGRYRWSGVPVIDLFQEGVLGLLRAAERFDWTRGTPFGAYASWWVRHAMSKAVGDAMMSVRLPDRLRSSLRRLAAERAADPSASWDALVERSGLDAGEAEDLAPLLSPPLSLDAGQGPDPGVPLGDVLADRDAEEAMEEVLVAAEAGRLLRIADHELTARERRILEARYGLGGKDPQTLREVGAQLGLTPQRVAQLEQRALGKLRTALGIDAITP
jgi:RNA polymerase sigma factor (sigma-70 family)